MDDIDALELDDEEWTRNLKSLVASKEERFASKRKRTPSPPTLSLRTELSEPRLSFPGPAGRDRICDQASEIPQNHDCLSGEASWRNAVRKFQSTNFDNDTIGNSVGQIIDGGIKGRTQKMIVFVVHLISNGNASAFARVKDDSGEIGSAIHRSVFREFPNLTDKKTMMINKVSFDKHKIICLVCKPGCYLLTHSRDKLSCVDAK
eukprot:g6069.t1